MPVREARIPPLRLHPAAAAALRILALAAAYYLAARVGLLFEVVRGQALRVSIPLAAP